jgi:alkylhydroperoxidase family enzyme
VPRLKPLPPETTPELKPHFDFFLGTLGFTPNSVLTMQRKPKLVQALAQLNGAVMDPEGEVDLGFRRLIGHVASKVSGCLYCQAHTAAGRAQLRHQRRQAGRRVDLRHAARTTARASAWRWTLPWPRRASPTR